MKKVITTFVVVMIVVSITMYRNKQSQIIPQISNIELIDVDSSLRHEAMRDLIAPYKAKKEASMNVVIGESVEKMEIGKPESKLTNLVADILLIEGRKYIADVDIAIVNIGGIRRALYEGSITIGDIFEVLPYDNAVLVLEYKGADILALADAIAAKGGESMAGMTLAICDGKAEDVRVGGVAVDSAKTYKVVTTDYLSWGNDGLRPLANYMKSTSLNMMLRDAVFDHVTCATIREEKIESKLDKRIIIR